MTPLRVLIVDDEPLARRRLKTLLKDEAELEIAGECEDGASAVAAAKRLSPDVMFLDVQMPGMDGFDVIEALGPLRCPAIVFVTAYDDYALKAFDVHAIDYLLKPFDRKRLRQALARARALALNEKEVEKEVGRRLLAAMAEVRRARSQTRIVVRSRGRVYFVRSDEIDWIEASGHYLTLHAGREEHLVRGTIKEMESRLDPDRFVRVHRSAIVNVDRIKALLPSFHGEYTIVLHDGTRLSSSRGHSERLQAIVKGQGGELIGNRTRCRLTRTTARADASIRPARHTGWLLRPHLEPRAIGIAGQPSDGWQRTCTDMRSIFESTRAFEAWMRKRTDVSGRLLKSKHRKMGAGAFPFLRATFYRWVEQWPKVCPRLAERDGDVLLVVGDLHVENFGVWRDSRQRLVWGINDFDDACELPFTSDLVRLAASVLLAAAAADLDVSADQVCALLLDGYQAGLRAEGQPILLADARYAALVELTRNTQEDPRTFWRKKLDPDDNPRIDAADLPKGLEDMFRASFPPGADPVFRAQKSPGGLGSLGRRRFSAVESPKYGGRTGREAKALVPSALYWWAGRDNMPSQTATLLQHAVRDPDPYFQVHDTWLVRQLAPDIAKIEMPENDRDKRLALAPALLRLMGRETANIHLGSRTRDALEKSLKGLDRDRQWFSAAAERMAACTRQDHEEWAKRYRD